MRALTQISIRSPAAIAVGVAITILFGVFALNSLPIQLFPDIDRPQIGIGTQWRAETPREIESQILQPEEEVLQGIPGLQEMDGFSNAGGAYVQLTFALGTDIKSTLVDVIGRLNRLPPLPADAQKPFVQLASTQDSNATLLYVFMQELPGNKHDINDYEQFLKDVVVPRLEAVPGVGSAQINGNGGTAELDIVFDPVRAAELGVQIPKMAQQIGGAEDISGGTIDVGRRQYGLSFRGRYSVADLKGLILEWRDGKPIHLGDIADVHVGRSKAQGFAYQDGNPALGISVFRASGANVLATVNAVKAELVKINEGPAKQQHVTMQYSFDPSHFINQAVGMVTSDLIVGILLAVGVLWFFMREWRGTLIISAAIPICLFAVVVLLNIAGRTLNVVSLAGLAFATGMVLDAAIVCFENILRLRERGMPAAEASQKGTDQVWGALLASTATNVAIFLPVIFLKDVEGQLFADLALTIAFAVFVSLIVAITVVPVASVLFLKTRPKVSRLTNVWQTITGYVMNLTSTPRKRQLWIGGLIAGSLVGTWLLIPSLQYLPQVKRAAIDGFIQFPAGTTVDFADKNFARPIINQLQPYMTGKKQPQLLNYYVKMDGPGFMDMAVRVPNDEDFPQLEKIVRTQVIKDLPDAQAFAQMGSLFGGFSEGGGISINLQSNDPEAMRAAAKKGFELLTKRFPEGVVNSNPNLDYDQPELKLLPDDRSIAEVGWTRPDVGNIAQAFGEGMYVGQRYDGERQLFLIVKSKPMDTPDAVKGAPVATPSGGIVPFGHLVSMQETLAPSGIYRLDRRRTFALNFQPPRGMALEDAMKIIRKDIEPQMRKLLPVDGEVTYGAAADHLDNALWSMGKNFGLAVLLLFLIMAALFKSVKDSAIATIALPLGTVGGMAALRLLGLFVFQPLDLLTMIGFIIVLGLVVNNTILLVARTRQAEAEGMTRVDAVRSSLETRLRPIFSSTLTAVFGMLPLVIVPGPGAEIYRGLGAVIVGGILVSHVFTLILIPAMLRLGEKPAAFREAPIPRTVPAGQGSMITLKRVPFSVSCAAALMAMSSFAVAQQAPPTPPKVGVVQARDVKMAPKVVLPGTVVARNDSHLAAEVEGRIAWVAEVGTVVKAGDVIARIDRNVSGMQLASDKANVARLSAQLNFDRSQAERMDRLFSQSAIAKATRDQASSTRDMDTGALGQAQASLHKSQFQYDHSSVRAPFPGRVVARLINTGEYATPGKEIVRLVQTDSIEVKAQAPIDTAHFLSEGMPLTVEVAKRPILARVRAIVPVGDEQSRTIEVRIALKSGDAFVGDAAKVFVPSAAPRDVLAVPRDALVLREDNTYIFKVDGKNRATRVAVETGTEDGSMIEVRGPIKAGERVIVRGAERLEAGQKVQPIFAS